VLARAAVRLDLSASPSPSTAEEAPVPRSRAPGLLRPLVVIVAVAACASPLPQPAASVPPAEAPARADVPWWKGSLHTHSVWSDGDDYPEQIARWYRDHGWNFVVFTEHDLLQEGDTWYDVNAPDHGWPPRHRSMRQALPAYRAHFGDAWVEERRTGDRHLVRLKTMAEYRHLVEEPGRFLLIMGEEITDRQGVHVNGVNLVAPIQPHGSADPGLNLRTNLAAVAAQRATTGRHMLAIVNHPNFLWALTAEDLARTPGLRFFEVHNGHGLVHNEGDAVRASTERMWDVALALRHAAGNAEPLFGVGTDDAHEYRPESADLARPGRAWVMVRAPRLDAALLVEAMERGDFYASTGVTLADVQPTPAALEVTVADPAGDDYTIEFIGTRCGFDPAPRRRPPGEDTLRTTGVYDPRIGAVLARVQGPAARYDFAGDELYVRARVTAGTLPPSRAASAGSSARAWTQPASPPRPCQ
jgi:hypothetical protein